jgi:hypothetical protein
MKDLYPSLSRKYGFIKENENENLFKGLDAFANKEKKIVDACKKTETALIELDNLLTEAQERCEMEKDYTELNEIFNTQYDENSTLGEHINKLYEILTPIIQAKEHANLTSKQN